jgi:hypothetical protein
LKHANALSLNPNLDRTSAALALLCVSSLAHAQVQAQARPEVNAAAMAVIAAEQEVSSTDMVAKAHASAGAAARAMLGQAADTLNPDELEAQLADRVPGFAGWVHKDDGSTVMMMVRSTKAGGAAPAELTRAMTSKVAVKPALWDSRQLLTFKKKVFSAASTQGVIATSIDREANRLEVTYNTDLDAGAIDALAAKLVASGVPRAALVMKPGELPRSIATTGVSVRAQPLPLAAGAQFNFTTSSGSFVCSLGVPAVRAGVRGFVTASHCSERVFSVTAGTTMTAPDGSFVGRETVDPAGFDCALADTLGCREGDALFVSGAPASAVDFGRVLITNSGSLTVAGTIPVTGAQSYPTAGQRVYKTGRTTGTRSGRVARVCVDALVGNGAGNTYGALCSVELNSTTFIQPGDSGSSVWLYDGTGAVVTGIVSYGSSTTGGFSPWGGVTKELGALTIR